MCTHTHTISPQQDGHIITQLGKRNKSWPDSGFFKGSRSSLYFAKTPASAPGLPIHCAPRLTSVHVKTWDLKQGWTWRTHGIYLSCKQKELSSSKPWRFLESCWSLVYNESQETPILISAKKVIIINHRANQLSGKREGQVCKWQVGLPSAMLFLCGLLPEGASHNLGGSSHMN